MMKRSLLALPLCLLPLTAAAQEDDRSYLSDLLEGYLSGGGSTVSIRGFEGALSSRATIRQISIADDQGIWLTLNNIVLDWSRSALLRGEVSVNELSAEEIILARAPISSTDASLPPPEASGFSLPDLPVSVDIGKIAAARLELGETLLGQPFEGQLEANLTLSGGEGATKLTLLRTDSGPAAQIALTASYGNESGVLAIDLDAREAAGGIVTTLAGLPGAPPVELTVKGQGPLTDYTAQIRLASEGQERLAGEVEVRAGEAGQTAFRADLSGDMAPLLLPDYATFFGNDLRLAANGQRAADGRLVLDTFDFRTRAMTLAGSLVLAADGLPERFALTGQIGLDGAPVLLPLTTDQRTEITEADLTLAFDATQGDGWTADVALTGLDRDDVKLQSATITGTGHIRRPTAANPGASFDGAFDIAATGLALADPALASAVGDQIAARLQLLWQEGADSFDLPLLQLTGAGYGFDGALSLQGLETALTVKGKGTARADDLSRFAALAGQPLQGRAEAQLAGEAALLAGSFDVEGTVQGTDLKTGIAEADNLLAGRSTMDLSIRRDETGTLLRRFNLAAGTLTAEAKGTLASTGSDIAAQIDFRDLSVLGAAYGGQLNGIAQFSGTPEQGRITLDTTGEGLTIGVAEADALLKGTSKITAEAEIAGQTVNLQSLKINAATLDLSAQGRIAAEGNDLSADLNFRDLSVLGGGYRGALAAQARFTGTPESGSLTATATGRSLAIGQPEADRLLAGETRLTADLALAGKRIQIRNVTLANPQLNANAKGQVEGENRRIELQAALANLGVLLPEFPGRLTVAGSATQDAQGYQLDLRGQGPGRIDASVKGRMASNFGTANLSITGSAQAGLANVFIAPRSVSGGLRFDLGLNGPLQVSALSGRISFADGRISDPDLPVALEGIALTANLARGRASVEGSTQLSSGGQVTANGTIGMTAPYNADLQLQLRQAVIRDPRLYETRLNGRVTVQGGLLGGARIGGDITLAETELRVPDTGIGAAAGLDDLRHLSEPGDVLETRRRAGLIAAESAAGDGSSGPSYPLDLRISAPQRVFIRGRGLDAEVGGELRLQGTTANVMPSGAFNLVRGRLDILGKRLTLSQALLQMEGDFDPYLSILASNESDGITASVQIEGRATEPTVSFVSSPELPEEEVLARLLFGRDLTSLSAFQAAQLASAVATLAGKGGDGIMSKLRKGFGLDDFDISTDAEGDTSVKAGKYISQNTYTEVEVDQNGQAAISLNLDLTESITVRGSAGADGETSIGIFKEKDY